MRQYPANQKYGMLSGGNDVSTRPLTVFTSVFHCVTTTVL
ncbi:hypothetical protein EC2729250_3347 [Escherichia coli 2729250]|nr:hypothetical protein EC2860050_3395 [Escherichia coli 2860050]EMZ81881.1 hypothetical protein ECP03052931_3608 [Escherichia coli p0305293.1]ENA50595.1 hypothetical protein EC2729250_3347 [Escherichia coli 2729250]ENA91730.1 hypothetical protein EC2860650_3294 [Escherichia coli 2860650]ENB06241.1 hypothetical protein EC2866350_2897 [Escherichia coli 2866350]END39932.1 hypothetical protein ECP030529313_3108 [Escherichia coli p0305293.13]ENE08551.1 hypothetical protein ECP030529314_3398 [Esch